MSDTFFKIDNLTKRFGGLTAVDGVSFDVRRDEIVGLIGPNGAGKTTLVRLIIGLLKPDRGRIYFHGEDITAYKTWSRVERGITATFQNTRPFRNMPIIANVMVACLGPRAARRGEWLKNVERRAMDALEFTGIADLAFEPASKLSHGDLKRLELARAIATEAELLILDEPFGGLSQSETELLAKSLRRLHRGGRFGRLHSEGAAMIIIEHKLSELMQLADRVVVMHYGRGIAMGTPDEIVNNPLVIEAYIGKESVSLNA